MTLRPAFRSLPRLAPGAQLAIAAACLACWSPAQAQSAYAQGPLLDLIRAMPAGSWKRVNANSFSDVWTPSSLRPLKGSSNPTPSKIIAAWSSFAWDSNRGDLILYGGGHANYSGNDVYRWRARTLKWERASLPSEIKYIGSSAYTAIDGANAAPASAHTYDNAIFLPLIDRYLNLGGAIYNSGGAYVRPSESNPSALRRTGPYLVDPALADGSKVGGTTGSHVKRVSPHPEIVGSQMWKNRDLTRNLAGQTLPSSHVNGCTAYSDESDTKDILYFGARSGGSTAMHLYRYVVTDLSQPSLDKITKVGAYYNSPTGQTTCALDPVARVFVKTGSNTSPFFFWNLATAGSSNYERRVSVSGSVADFTNWLSATGKKVSHCAMDHDPNRRRFTIWCGDGNLWTLKPPSPLGTTGWTMSRLTPSTSTVPEGLVGTGLLGRWKYIPGFDVFIGLQNSTNGNIWVYKPSGWVAPVADGGEESPTVAAMDEAVGNPQPPMADDGEATPPPAPPTDPTTVETALSGGDATVEGAVLVLASYDAPTLSDLSPEARRARFGWIEAPALPAEAETVSGIGADEPETDASASEQAEGSAPEQAEVSASDQAGALPEQSDTPPASRATVGVVEGAEDVEVVTNAAPEIASPAPDALTAQAPDDAEPPASGQRHFGRTRGLAGPLFDPVAAPESALPSL